MISVRVSAEEYETLKAMYEARGIRSVSELARDAMHRFLNTSPAPEHAACENQIRTLDARLNTLQGEIKQLSKRLSEIS